MAYRNSPLYLQDLDLAVHQTVGIEKLYGKSVMITGATGLVGSFMVDMLMRYNQTDSADITVYAVGRSIQRLEARFSDRSKNLVFVEHDVNDGQMPEYPVDYLIHAASNAYPAAFNQDPVGTIMSNIGGTKLLLDYALTHKCTRFLFVSSGEVYGQGDLSLEVYPESYSGYIDPTQPRSCYPSSKRTAETLCAAYLKQYGLDTVIVRPCHTYGPNATRSDNRANVQFVNNALAGEKIILNSAGTQLRSYCYIADSVSGILTVLLNGAAGTAYNIANNDAKATIFEYAKYVAASAGTTVEFTSPDVVAMAERTPITRQVLDAAKLESLGWKGSFSVEKGVEHTLRILREL